MSENQENNFIQVNGVLSKGYGFSPQAVMRDIRLTPEAKCIYAYMSSFAGAGLSAFPTVSLQLYELGMGEKRYYKHRKLLEQFGYITIKRTRVKTESGKVVGGKNIYTLEQFPVEKKCEKQDSEPSQNDSVQNESVQNAITNNNNFNNNNFNNNNFNSSSSKDDDDEVKKIMKICQLQNFKLKREDAESLLLVYDFTKISKAIITASSIANKIKNYKGYLVSVLNDMEKVKVTNIKIDKDNKPKSNNFTERKYDEDFYCDLEENLNTNKDLENNDYDPIKEYFEKNKEA